MIKKIHLSALLTFVFISTFYFPPLFAESVGIPEAAVARLGKGRIYDLQYSPDGTRLVAASSAGIWLYDATTYKELAYLTKRGIATHKRIVFSPDSSTFASADKYESIANGLVHLWNVKSGWNKRQIWNNSEIDSLAFSPDGKTLATGDTEDIRFWDPHTGDIKMELKRPPEVKKWAVISLAFSPDGNTLASGFWKTICLWNTETGELTQTLEGHEERVNALAFSADGSTLVSASWDGSIRLWDTQTGNQQQKWNIDIEDHIQSLALSLDGSLCVGGYYSGNIHLFRTKTGTRIQTLKGHSQEAISVTFSADMRTIASGSADGSIRIWEVASGETERTFTGYYGKFISLAVSADGKTIATPASDYKLYLWDTTTFALQNTLDTTDFFPINTLAFNPEGTTIATTDAYLAINLRNRETSELIDTIHGHQLAITNVAYSPDGKTIVSGSADYTIRLWDAETREQKKIILGHEDGVLSVAYSPDGKTIASSCSDTVRLWDVGVGKQRKNLSGPFSSDPCFAFSPDSKILATSGPKRTVYLWDVETGGNIGYRAGYQSMIETIISSIAFSPDGKLIATGARNGTVTVLDVDLNADGLTQHLHTFEKTHKSEGHRSKVVDVAFVADGKVLVSRSTDGVVYLWDVVIKE